MTDREKIQYQIKEQEIQNMNATKLAQLATKIQALQAELAKLEAQPQDEYPAGTVVKFPASVWPGWYGLFLRSDQDHSAGGKLLVSDRLGCCRSRTDVLGRSPGVGRARHPAVYLADRLGVGGGRLMKHRKKPKRMVCPACRRCVAVSTGRLGIRPRWHTSRLGRPCPGRWETP